MRAIGSVMNQPMKAPPTAAMTFSTRNTGSLKSNCASSVVMALLQRIRHILEPLPVLAVLFFGGPGTALPEEVVIHAAAARQLAVLLDERLGRLGVGDAGLLFVGRSARIVVVDPTRLWIGLDQ